MYISVGWTIKDENCNLTPCSCPSYCIKTVPQQLNFLFCTFQHSTICSEYTICLDGDLCGVKNVKPNNLVVEKNHDTPVTYNASWEFVVGKLGVSVNEGS